ncbi:hypothetical protein HK22_00855 [Gluconobacter sp. DsW_056]|uniref:Uncharacterized protein n=1 Tax=Gluconobacter albidus TaxID=318683 RepID=A0AAW3R0X6_9PROT|nr:hypothetical protein AD941_00810 [Gluconobacter albidus]OUI81443.1 hypothetical protein HK22_00855 [Gluconobacter sp. DsW_056]
MSREGYICHLKYITTGERIAFCMSLGDMRRHIQADKLYIMAFGHEEIIMVRIFLLSFWQTISIVSEYPL